MKTKIIFQKCERCGKTLVTANLTGARNPVGVLCEACATPEEKHECDMAVVGHIAAQPAPTASLVYYIRVPQCGCTFERRGATTYFLLHRIAKCPIHYSRTRAYRADEIRYAAQPETIQ